MKTTLLTLLISVLGCMSSIGYAQGDPISVDVELSRSRLYVGDDVTYQIIVRGADNPPTPEIDFPDSVRAKFHGRTSQSFTSMRSINGRNRTYTDRRYSFQYTLTGIEEGTIEIPAPSIVIDGQRYTGQNASFESIFPVRSDMDDLELSVPQTEIYLNQTIEIECSWWIGDQSSNFSFSSSSLPKSFGVRGVEPRLASSQKVRFEINGQQVFGVVVTGQHRGKEMTRLLFWLSVTPSEVGDFSIGPIRAVFTRRGGSGGSYKAYAESSSIPVTVNRVPTENQPDGYTGVIGDLRLSTYASNTNVNVGDPIELTLSISGQEPMLGVDDAPNLSGIPSFAQHFKVSSEGWREKRPRKAGKRIFQTTIRALDDSIDQIPAIGFPSFNPATGSFRINKSSPIDIVVNPVEELTLEDAVITGGGNARPAESSVERSELSSAHPGLWAHGTVDQVLEKPGFSFESALKPIWIGAVASGPAIFAFSLLIGLIRDTRASAAGALRMAYRRSRFLDRKGLHAKAVRMYIAAALGINEDAIVAGDASRLPIDEDTVRAAGLCLAGSEWDVFAGSTQMNTTNEQDRPNLLRDIHTQLRAANKGRS
jgi:BatD DUF11 like domain